jgi:hypothetical protein
VSSSSALHDCYLPIYKTPEGLKIYTETLEVVSASFPQYLRELQGIADGSGVEFHKVSCEEENRQRIIQVNFLLAISLPS